MAEENKLLKLKNIKVTFEKRNGLLSPVTKIGAIADLNLDIYPGEIVALVGESGCGKTTLGKVVTGLLKPSAGEVSFNGVSVSKMTRQQFNEYRKGVQMVQQDSYAALNPTRTIFDSLSGPILEKKIVKSRTEAYDKVCELMKIVELNPPELYIKKYPHQLSGGQRQRILMARAISLNPRLVVADEPVSMIDVSLRISVLNLMSSLNKRLGIAFIYITHDLATARYIAQEGRIAVMYLGKIVEVGNVMEVLSNPRHPYLQVLLSAVPIPDPIKAKTASLLPLKSIDMPSIVNPPKGCRFHPRCIYAEARCEMEEPVMRKFGNSTVACHCAERIPEFKFTSDLVSD